MNAERDDLAEFVAELPPDLVEAARAEVDRADEVLCPYETCTVFVDGSRVRGGWGPVGCPCGDATHYAGLRRPGPPVLAWGRHGSRAQRARARRAAA